MTGKHNNNNNNNGVNSSHSPAIIIKNEANVNTISTSIDDMKSLKRQNSNESNINNNTKDDNVQLEIANNSNLHNSNDQKLFFKRDPKVRLLLIRIFDEKFHF